MAKDASMTVLEGLLAAAGVKLPSPYERVDVEIERQGKKIILPDDPREMEIPEAIKHLKRIEEDEKQVFSLHEVIDAHPYDALIAFNKAMRDLYGWTSPVPTPGFFGPTPPEMVSVPTSHNPKDTVQVPIGTFKIPSVENEILVQIARHKNRWALHIHGEARRVEKAFLLELVNRAREFVRTESIYRGKAVAAKVSNKKELEQELTFFDVTGVSKDDILLNDVVYEQVNVNLWAPVENTAACRKHKIPLKRGVLLEGKYGTGKSLAARVTAKVCQDNGWTFLHLDNVDGLANALIFAEQYSPCVVFAEDIDRVLSERSDAANQIVNVLDGVLSKRAEVITVLTTNHVDQIEPVMLRPGRLDAVITITPPDEKTVEKLVHLYGAGLVSPEADLKLVCKELAGQIPATIREVVERSKLAMVARGEREVSGEALMVAAVGMTTHLNLLNRPRDEPTPAENLWKAMRSLMDGSVSDDGSEIIGLINDNTDEEAANTREVVTTSTANESQRVRAAMQQQIKKVMDAVSAMHTDIAEIKDYHGIN